MVEKAADNVCQTTQINGIQAGPASFSFPSRKISHNKPRPQTAISGSAGTVRFQFPPAGQSTDQGKTANNTR